MALKSKLNREQLLNCALCPNLCRCDCPVLQVTGREAVAPAAKARQAALVTEGHLIWTQELLKAVSNCLGCRNCTLLCPFADLNLCDELLNARSAENKAAFSLPVWDPFLLNLKKFSSPYGRRQAGLAETKGSPPEVIFFAGCTATANNMNSVTAAGLLLQKAGVSYVMIEEDCCGYPAESWSEMDLARQLAEENCRKINSSGAKLLVTNCPECWQTFSERYPAWGFNLECAVVDGPSYFLKLVTEGRLKPRALDLKKVSYHDPCIWARTANKISEPRDLIASIPGLKLKETEAGGKDTHCCGGGRMFQLSFPDTAEKVALKRLSEFDDDAVIVTACPFCREGLLKDKRPVFELVELLAKACLD